MKSRSELRAERRAQDASGSRFDFASGEGPRTPVDASEGECVGVDAEPATSVSNRFDTLDVLALDNGEGPAGLVKLRTSPIVREVLPVHPLRAFIEARDLGIAEAAALLDVSERSLREILAWRAHFPRRKAQFIARYLHEDPEALFPPRP
jgi:hypothetical protein